MRMPQSSFGWPGQPLDIRTDEGWHGFGIVNEAKIRPPKAKISNVETPNV